MRDSLGLQRRPLPQPALATQTTFMANPKLEELLKLPPAERIELAMALWDSVEDSPEIDALFPLTDAQRAELDRRLAEHERNPSSGVPWDEVQRRLLDRS